MRKRLHKGLMVVWGIVWRFIGVVWRVLGIAACIALVVIPLGLIVSTFWDPMRKIRSDVWGWVTSPSELGRFGWETLTGPPAAGALAVTAAWIAYTGIKKQVAEQKVANENAARVAEEAKRKNRDEQWWKTLEWAYTEAKTFAEKDVQQPGGIFAKLRSLAQPKTLTDRQKTTESQALIAILRSLGRPEGAQDGALSALQKTTVAEVLGMFGASPYEGVQKKAHEALNDLGRSFGYEKSLLAALDNIDPHVGALTDNKPVVFENQRVTYDGVFRTAPDRLIAIETKYRARPLDRNQLASILAHLPVEGKGLHNVNQLLIVANTPPTVGARKMLEQLSSRVGYVTWDFGESVDEIQRELKRLAGAG